MQGTRRVSKLGGWTSEAKPINTNPLGLLIVLKPKKSTSTAGSDRRRQSSANIDENESSAFSYSESDADSDSDWDQYGDRRAYLNDINDEYLTAMVKEQEVRFQPCRKLKLGVGGSSKTTKEKSTKRKNVYKRGDKESESRHHERPRVSISIDSPKSSPKSRQFWSPTSSWSALGRLLGRKLKHGHSREEVEDDGERTRRSSIQTNSSSTAADTDDELLQPTRLRSSSYGDDPLGFLRQIQAQLLNRAVRKNSGDVSHLKVVSKNAGGTPFTVRNTSESLAVCREYFSRLTCYDTMPNSSQVVAIDTRTPMEEVFNVLHRHRTASAVVWNSSSSDESTLSKICDMESLVHRFWPEFIRNVSSASKEDVSECGRRPLKEFVREDDDQKDDQQTTTMTFLCKRGISAETSLMEAARVLCTPLHIPSTEANGIIENRQYASSFLPLINELTDDVIHILSANDILRFVSRELCKFELTSAFDNVTISVGAKQDSSSSTSSCFVRPVDSKWWLYTDDSLESAAAKLIESRSSVLPIFDGPESSSPHYVGMLSVADLVDLVGKRGYCHQLSKPLNELLIDVTKKDVPVLDTNTPISKLLKTLGTTWAEQQAPWDSLLPSAIVLNDKGEFAGFIRPEQLLTIVLSLGEQQQSQQQSDDRARPQQATTAGNGACCRTSSPERRDSGLGGDEGLLFPDDANYLTL